MNELTRPSDDDFAPSASDYLRDYFKHTRGNIFLACIRNTDSKLAPGQIAAQVTRSIGKIDQFIAKYDKPETETAIYYCTATLRDGRNRRTAENCWQFPSLFADIDDKNHALSHEQVIKLLDALPYPPTFIVVSGHGLQPHWLADSPSEDAERIGGLRRKLQSILASDSVPDPPRLMRLPGSHNSKFGDWLPVEVVRHTGKRYTLDEMETWLKDAKEIIRHKHAPKTNGATTHTTSEQFYSDNDEERIRAVLPYINAIDRAVWLEVGMALKSHLGEHGRSLWDQWAASCPDKFSDRDQDKTWRSFKRDGIGIGTLFHHARQGGWRWQKEQPSPSGGASQRDDGGIGRDSGDELPDLVIKDSNLPATAKALARLIAQGDYFLFNGFALVRIAAEAHCMPRALEVTAEAVRVHAHEISQPIKIRKIKDKDTGAETLDRIPATLTKDVAALYLNGLEGQWGLPRFRGITTAPILRDDGSIRIATGYDPESELYCHNIPEITVAANPAYQDAMNALRGVRSFFCTFPFADSEKVLDPKLGVHVIDQNKPIGMDESTFLVALVSAVCRASLDFAPAFLARAPNISGAGTGKGFLVKAIAIIASGAKPTAFTGGHDKEEFEKRMTAALIEAQPVVFLDNYNAAELKSDVLASALTEDPCKVRPFGVTAQIPLHTRAFFCITGNAVEIAEDMARRILVTDIDAGMADPEARPFAPGFLDRVFDTRAELLAHALTIWRWGRQNEQRPGKPLGNYETWAQWCRDPLLALGCRDPVDRIAEIKAADPRRRALVAIFDTWWAFHGDAAMKATDLAIEVLELIDQKAKRNDDGSLKYNRQWVAGWLNRHGRTCLGGYTLSMTKDDTHSRPITYYTLTNGNVTSPE